jgi:hypothetical protein
MVDMSWKSIVAGELVQRTHEHEIRYVTTPSGSMLISLIHYDAKLIEVIGCNPQCEIAPSGQHEGRPLYAVKRLHLQQSDKV